MSKAAKANEKIVSKEKWSKHFGKWFRKVLIDGKILDYRYPIKGAGVWLPYGFKIRENVFKVIRNQLDSTGHNEALFPLLVPESSLQKEAEHVEGFEAQVFWVTQGGQKQLKQKLALARVDNTTTASQRFRNGIFSSSSGNVCILVSTSLMPRMQLAVECCD